MINFDFPQFMPKKKKEEPLFIPIGTQTTTPAILPSKTNDNTSTLSNFLPALSETTRKTIAQGPIKSLFSKEPAPTWKEAGKQFAQSAIESNKMKGIVMLNGQQREVNAFNPIAILSGEPLKSVGLKKLAPQAKNLTTKFISYIDDKLAKNPDATLSRQEITDFAKRPELKKSEADLLNRLGSEVKDTKIPAQDFADSIRRDLLELKPVKVKEPQYGNVNIEREVPDYQQYGMDADAMAKAKLKGRNYEEVVFESPITTNGSSHFPNSKNYFAHARGDEVVEGGKKIWREQEIQSDLLQKEGLDKAFDQWSIMKGDENQIKIKARLGEKGFNDAMTARQVERTKLEPFTNDRFGERIMRERIKEKAQAGYTSYRLPTGETIGKIEGFEGANNWFEVGKGTRVENTALKPNELKVGMAVNKERDYSEWIITDILGDGRFKAVPKHIADKYGKELPKPNNVAFEADKETFDLTGKSNPQYRRYSDWGKFLKNKFGGKEITDPQGNKWIEIDLKKEQGRMPIEAFGAVALPFLPQDKKEEPLFVNQDEKMKTSTPFMMKEKPNFTYESQESKNRKSLEGIKFPDSVIKKEIKSVEGTNYDPTDPKQNRPDATPETLGIGADLVRMDESMVAVPRQKDGKTGMLRMGTVVYVPELKKRFLVADLKNERFNGRNMIDFVTLGTKEKPIPQFNKNFTIQIIREGKGYGDARQLVESGEWEKIKNESNGINLY